MGLKLITDSAAEPVDATTVKAWARIDGTDEDDLIDLMIPAARKAAEAFCERYFSTRTVQLLLDAFPTAEIKLPRAPVDSIDFVKYYDIDGTLTLIDPSNYTFEQAHGDPSVEAWLVPVYGYSWPSTQDIVNAVQIQYDCGYATCPEDVKQYIVAHVAAAIGQRELIAQSDRVPRVVEFYQHLLDPYRVF